MMTQRLVALVIALLMLASALPVSTAGTGRGVAREIDDDNTFLNATDMASGKSYPGNLSSLDDMQDFYKASSPGAGKVFNVSVFVISYPALKVQLVAFDPTGAMLEVSALDSPWQSVSVLAVKSNTPYFFAVVVISGSGDYAINHLLESPTPIAPASSVSNNPLAREGNNPADWYTFNMNGGTNGGLNNDVAQFTIDKSPGVTLDVTIYALWTELMAYTFNISLDHQSGAKIAAAASYSGPYYLKVWARSGNGTYNVSLGVLQSAPNDNDQDGDHATKLNGTPASSWVDQAFDHYDFYKLYLLKDDALDVTMKLNNHTMGKYVLWLYHISGGLYTPVANASNFVPGAGWMDSVRLTYSIGVDDRYFIIPMAENGLDAQGNISSNPANASYTLTLNSPASLNHAPIVVNSPGYPVMNENGQFTLLTLNSIFQDPDGDVMTFNVTGSAHIAAKLNADGSATLTPDKYWFGVEKVNLTATDCFGASTTLMVSVQVIHVNQAPIVKNQIPNITIQEDFTYELNLSASFWDPDVQYAVDTLTYCWTGNTSIPMSLNTTNLILTFGPVHGFLGVRGITLFATDTAKLRATQKFQVTVNHTDHSPKLKNASRLDIEIPEDGVNSSFLARDFFTDEDTFYTTDSLQYVATPSAHINCTMLADSRIEVRPEQDWNGAETVHVTAVDTGNLTAVLDVSVVVDLVNDPPYIANYTPFADEVGINETENLTLSVDVRDIDTPLSQLTYAWYVDDERVSSAGTSYTFTTDLNTSRQLPYIIRVDVSDGEYTVNHGWTVPVFNKDQPPQVTIDSPAEGGVYPAADFVALRVTAFSPEFNKMTYTWKDGNVTLGNMKSMKWMFSPGWHNVSVQVYDGFVTTVADVTIFSDSPPTIQILSPKDMSNFKTTDGIRFSASVYDLDGDAVTFEWREGTKVLSREGNFTLKLGRGVHYIRINASDGHGFAQTPDLVVKVEESKKSGFLPGPVTGMVLAAAAVALIALWRRRE
jgi:hypothetical protein